MDNRLKVIIGLIVFLIMPVLMAYVVAKLFVSNKGEILFIIFLTLIVLELVCAVLKFIKMRDRDK